MANHDQVESQIRSLEKLSESAFIMSQSIKELTVAVNGIKDLIKIWVDTYKIH